MKRNKAETQNNFVKKYMDRLTKPVRHVDRKRKSKYIRGSKFKQSEEN